MEVHEEMTEEEMIEVQEYNYSNTSQEIPYISSYRN